MADQNIDLGSISWDLSSIDKQILDNRKQLQGYSEALKFNKDALKQQSKEIQNAAKTIILLEEMQRELNKSLDEGTISQDDYVEAMAAVNTELQETRNRTAEVVATQSELIQSNIDMERSVRDLQQETRTLNTLRQAGREEAYEEIGAYKGLNDELNALKRESKDLGATLVQMKLNGEENTDAYKALEDRYKSVTAQAEALNSEFVNLDQAVGDSQRQVGNYTESIKNAFSGLTDGFNKMISGDIQGGLEDIKENLKGVKDTASDLFKTIAANPWVAVLTVVLAGLIAYTKAVIDHNQYITEANGKVEDLAHTTGELTNELRRAGEAISETFENKSFENAITEMDALMDDFKISSKEAWDTYVNGLAAGGAANDEFGDSIKEYGALFAQNGYSAQQFINILNTGINLGIYSDKLPDAIKEAGLALNEQTKSTRDALVNSFGAPFSDQLLKNVQQGRLTVAQALDEIADKAETTNLNQQQQAQLTADLFKGAGEDAGGSIVIFEALNKAQNTTSDNLTELQKQTVELTNLNLEVQKSKDAAFASDSVKAFRKDLDITWKNIQVGSYNSLGYVTEFIKGSSNGFKLLWSNWVDFVKIIPFGFREVSKSVSSDIGKIAQIASTAGEVIKDAFTLDLTSAKAGYQDLSNQLKNFNSSTLASLSKVDDYLSSINSKNVDRIRAQNQARLDAQNLEDDAEAKRNAANNKTTGATGEEEAKARLEAQKKADAEAKKAETKRLAEAKKAAEESKKIADDLAKREIDTQKEKAQQASDIAKGELAEYIRVNAEKYKDDKSIAAKKLQDQLDYFDTVAKKQKALTESEREAAALSIDIQIKALETKRELNETELKELQNLREREIIINLEAKEKDAETDQIVNEKKKELSKRFNLEILEQEKLARAIMFQQKILDLEAQGDQEFDLRREQIDYATTVELEKYADKYNRQREIDLENYDINEDIELTRKEIQTEMDASDDETERLRLQNQLGELMLIEENYAENSKKIDEAVNTAKLQGLQGAFSTAKGLFKENTLAYKAMAIAEATISTYLSATKALAEVPYPINYVVMGVNIAAGLAQVAKIATTKGYSGGGYTGDGGVNEVAGLVHKGEVVWSQADVQAMGGAAIVNAMRPTAGGYFGGAIGVSDMPNVQSAMMGGSVVVMLDENSVSLLADATYTGTQKGIGDMADNTEIRLGANFG